MPTPRRLRRVSPDQKLAFLLGLDTVTAGRILSGERPVADDDFEDGPLDGDTSRRLAREPEGVVGYRLNPNEATRAQLEKVPGFAIARIDRVLDGRPYFSLDELAAVTALSIEVLQDLFEVPAIAMPDKAGGGVIGLAPIAGRYVVRGNENENDGAIEGAGYRVRGPAARGSGILVVEARGGTFESPIAPHALKAAFDGDVVPVLRDADGGQHHVVPGSIDIWFVEGTSADRRSAILKRLNLKPSQEVAAVGYVRAALRRPPADRDRLQATVRTIARANEFEEVAFAEFDQFGFEDFGPTAAEMAVAGDLEGGARSWHYDSIDLQEAHAITRGDPKVVMVPIDSGMDLDHPLLADGLHPRWEELDLSFDIDEEPTVLRPEGTLSHGTKVSGVLRAVAPACRLLPVKIPASAGGAAAPGYGLRAAAIRASLKAAGEGERLVLNLSWRTESMHIGIRQALVEADACNVPVVTSAGNFSGSDPQVADAAHYPSGHAWKPPFLKGLISVAAVGYGDVRASYSYFGTNSITVCAPGGEYGEDGTAIYTTSLEGSHTYTWGTSFAAPHVAGVVSLLLAADPTLTAGEVREIICKTAESVDPFNAAVFRGQLGAGRINAVAALQKVVGAARLLQGHEECRVACEGGGGAGVPGLIDINSAAEAELLRLPGVGANRAREIIAHRRYTDAWDLVDAGVFEYWEAAALVPLIAFAGDRGRNDR